LSLSSKSVKEIHHHTSTMNADCDANEKQRCQQQVDRRWSCRHW